MSRRATDWIISGLFLGTLVFLYYALVTA